MTKSIPTKNFGRGPPRPCPAVPALLTVGYPTGRVQGATSTACRLLGLTLQRARRLYFDQLLNRARTRSVSVGRTKPA